MLTREILRKFCSPCETRNNINAPFLWGGRTYASDGRIIIETTIHYPDLIVGEGPASMEKVLPFFDVCREFGPLPPLPEIRMVTCHYCEGDGAEWFCEECEGAGKWEDLQPVPVGKALAGDMYLRMIRDNLTNPLIAYDAANDAGIEFRFDGGRGLLMPMRESKPVPLANEDRTEKLRDTLRKDGEE